MAMMIRALDTYGLNPGDLSWEPFRKLGDFQAYPTVTDEVITESACDTEALLIDLVGFDAERFSRFPRLKYLGLFATGYDCIDLDAARAAGVAVTNVPAYSTASVTQMTIALLFNVAHRIVEYNTIVHDGGWRAGRPFAYHPASLIELEDKALAVLGFGEIGCRVARYANALGMRILGHLPNRKAEIGVPVEWMEWKPLLAKADAVTLHLPLTSRTRGIINAETIALMKPGALLVNTARGGLVDDAALAAALRSGHIGGAGLDVLGFVEPPSADNPLLNAPNCVITPHIAWATRASRKRCLEEAALNLAEFIQGRERNRLV